ncbi:type II secretion system protein [Patescibacteria group bacterium]|nr:type II secretion system protein [Patescibacteria group bacterium]MCH8889318.1 type II secretion system protein [Patescibacteria group bacterium]
MINHKKGGFTLIELLVVIAIIGILSSVVLASLNTARQKARDARRISDLGQVQLALELYFDSCTQYPPDSGIDLLPALGEAAGCGGTTNWGTFIPVNPTDPVTDVLYGYERVSVTDYCAGAVLEDSTHPNAQSECTVTGGGPYNHQVAP